jgi:hypothetical protein
MYCSICSYSWCWTCGFGERHFFHRAFFGGVICQLFNAFSFGFELPIHWSLRLIGSILAFFLGPVIFIIGSIISYFALLCEKMEYSEMPLLFCISPPKSTCLLISVYFPLVFIQILIGLCLWIAGACIILVIGVVPFYLCFIIVGSRILVRFCLFSKKNTRST